MFKLITVKKTQIKAALGFIFINSLAKDKIKVIEIFIIEYYKVSNI